MSESLTGDCSRFELYKIEVFSATGLQNVGTGLEGISDQPTFADVETGIVRADVPKRDTPVVQQDQALPSARTINESRSDKTELVGFPNGGTPARFHPKTEECVYIGFPNTGHCNLNVLVGCHELNARGARMQPSDHLVTQLTGENIAFEAFNRRTAFGFEA